LAKIRKLDKNIPILYLIGEADKLTIDYAKLIEANAIGVGARTIVDKAFVNFAHSNDIELWKWTVDDDNEMQQLIDIGLDGLITNFPKKALQKLSATSNKRD